TYANSRVTVSCLPLYHPATAAAVLPPQPPLASASSASSLACANQSVTSKAIWCTASTLLAPAQTRRQSCDAVSGNGGSGAGSTVTSQLSPRSRAMNLARAASWTAVRSVGSSTSMDTPLCK